MPVKKRRAGSTNARNNNTPHNNRTTTNHHHHNSNHANATYRPDDDKLAVNGKQKITAAEAAEFVKKAGVDPSTQIVRLLAIYRFLLFCTLVYHFVRHMPHHPYKSRLMDPWLTYDQFHWPFFVWSPKEDMDFGGSGAPFSSTINPWANFYCISFMTFGVFWGMLCAMGGINGMEHSFHVSGTIFLVCYAWKFFTFCYIYTDTHYLLFLLGIVTVVSGGGSFFLIFTQAEPQMTLEQQALQRHRRRILIQESEWGAITLRLQYAVVYLFMALWRLHPDSIMGWISKGNLVELEQQGQSRGIPWTALNQNYMAGQLFQIMGMGGFLLHWGMFLGLAVRRPKLETTRQFFFWTVLFHVVYSFLVGNNIGSTFSFVCVLGVMIFYPIGGGSNVADEVHMATAAGNSRVQNDIRKRIRYRHAQVVEGNLFTWVQRYATGNDLARATKKQQLFTIAWIAIQLVLPLRMPLVSSGNFAYTREGYRFSWTMMLHHRETKIVHTERVKKQQQTFRSEFVSAEEERTVPLELFYAMPQCWDSVGGTRIQRRDYMPDRASATEDPRTIPLSMLKSHHAAFVKNYPRHMSRVAGGVAIVLFRMQLEACAGEPVAVYGTHFAKINYHGAYSRLWDPTVDIAQAEVFRLWRPWWETWRDVILDKAPDDYEYTLRRGIGSIDKDGKIERHTIEIAQRVTNARRIEFIADRAACLVAGPLALWPNMASMAFIPLEVPDDITLTISSRITKDPNVTTVTAGGQWDSLIDPPIMANMSAEPNVHAVQAISVEIGAIFTGSSGSPRDIPCAETTEEDVLIALIFLDGATPW